MKTMAFGCLWLYEKDENMEKQMSYKGTPEFRSWWILA